jgi:hypothetical protein
MRGVLDFDPMVALQLAAFCAPTIPDGDDAPGVPFRDLRVGPHYCARGPRPNSRILNVNVAIKVRRLRGCTLLAWKASDTT